MRSCRSFPPVGPSCCLYEDEAALRDKLQFRAKMGESYAQSIETLDRQDRLLDLARDLGRQVTRDEADEAREQASDWRALASSLEIPSWPQDIPEQAKRAREHCAVCQAGIRGPTGLG